MRHLEVKPQSASDAARVTYAGKASQRASVSGNRRKPSAPPPPPLAAYSVRVARAAPATAGSSIPALALAPAPTRSKAVRLRTSKRERPWLQVAAASLGAIVLLATGYLAGTNRLVFDGEEHIVIRSLATPDAQAAASRAPAASAARSHVVAPPVASSGVRALPSAAVEGTPAEPSPTAASRGPASYATTHAAHTPLAASLEGQSATSIVLDSSTSAAMSATSTTLASTRPAAASNAKAYGAVQPLSAATHDASEANASTPALDGETSDGTDDTAASVPPDASEVARNPYISEPGASIELEPKADRTTEAQTMQTNALPELPTREAVKASLEQMRPVLASCADPARGTTYVNLTLNGAGRATYAEVEGTFAGTPAGSCMARALRSGSYPKFSAPAFKVRYPYVF